MHFLYIFFQTSTTLEKCKTFFNFHYNIYTKIVSVYDNTNVCMSSNQTNMTITVIFVWVISLM